MDMSEERIKFAERFNEIVAALGYTGRGRQSYLATYYHLKQPSVKKWFDGDAMPDYEICADLCKRAKISFEWFMTGRGEKNFSHSPAPAPQPTLPAQNPSPLPAATQTVIQLMTATDDRGRAKILDAAKDAYDERAAFLKKNGRNMADEILAIRRINDEHEDANTPSAPMGH